MSSQYIKEIIRLWKCIEEMEEILHGMLATHRGGSRKVNKLLTMIKDLKDEEGDEECPVCEETECSPDCDAYEEVMYD